MKNKFMQIIVLLLTFCSLNACESKPESNTSAEAKDFTSVIQMETNSTNKPAKNTVSTHTATSTSPNTNNQTNTDGIIPDNDDNWITAPLAPLCDSCDRLLTRGYSTNGDCYELVANESETFAGVTVEVGVIKNNEWLLEPTTNMPLVDDDKTLYGTYVSGLDSVPEEIYYIGNGCFFYRNCYKWGSSGKTYEQMVYNAENGKCCEIKYNYTPTPSVAFYAGEVVVTEEYIIWQYVIYGDYVVCTILNTTTMETYDITIENNGHDPKCHPFSGGLFAITTYNDKINFYDRNGKMVLDLSSYTLADYNETIMFYGKSLSIDIINNNSTKYRIIIDKSGNVIRSYQLK